MKATENIVAMPFFLTTLLLLLLGGVGVLCDEVRINSADGLIELSNNVSVGTNYSGTTVLLDSDIALSGKAFEPIGNFSKYFLGTFDGQGHTISNLVTNSTSQYVGLFGYSYGTIIKNVVMDSSCSVTDSYGSPTHAGSIIGYCSPNNGPCIIENSVNMGSISFNGNVSDQSMILGGIAGFFASSNHTTEVKNCVNYGPLVSTRKSIYVLIGGIVGQSQGGSSIISIQNCVNYGSITFDGKAENYVGIGGIIGFSQSTIIENCLSTGKITSSETGYIGGVVGNVFSSGPTNITHCIWTSDVGCDAISNGTGTTNIKDSSFIETLNSTTIAELNEYAEKEGGNWSRWVMLHLNGGSIKNFNQSAQILTSLKSLPVPAKEGYELLFWCVDENCTEKYDSNKTYSSEVTDLYALWAYIYFLMFDYSNGTKTTVAVPSNETIKYPEDMKMEGYTFKEWSPNPVRMPAENITVTAQWTIIPAKSSESSTSPEIPSSSDSKEKSEYVEIIFARKDMRRDEAEKIIEKYTDGAEYTIEKIEKGSGETKVIIKFVDCEKATNFIEKVVVSSEYAKYSIKKVGYIPASELASFSSTLKLFAFVFFSF